MAAVFDQPDSWSGRRKLKGNQAQVLRLLDAYDRAQTGKQRRQLRKELGELGYVWNHVDAPKGLD